MVQRELRVPSPGRWQHDAVEVTFEQLPKVWQDYVVKLYASTSAMHPGKPVRVKVGRRPDGRWVYAVDVSWPAGTLAATDEEARDGG